jgi:hypothetical protein
MSVVIEVDSPTYGVYHKVCIGIIDFHALAVRYGADLHDWVIKFHPRHYFPSHTMRVLFNRVDSEGNDLRVPTCGVFVPTSEVNQAWDCRGTKYGSETKYRIKKLPISCSDKEVLRWQQSLPDAQLVPEAFRCALTMEELQKSFSPKS